MNTYDASEIAYKRGYESGFAASGVLEPEGCGCVSNAYVYGLRESVRGAKLPMSADPARISPRLTDGIRKLAQSGKGEGHDQWLTGVIVQFDLTFSNKAWVEAERYHFLDFVSSQSTMHKMAAFDLDTLYNEYTDKDIIKILKKKKKEYEALGEMLADPSKKLSPAKAQAISEQRERLYLELLYSNPAGCMLTARMTTNYRQLKTIYSQRRFHRLPEWREFCEWIEKLPYSELITGKEAVTDENCDPEADSFLRKEINLPEKEVKQA